MAAGLHAARPMGDALTRSADAPMVLWQQCNTQTFSTGGNQMQSPSMLGAGTIQACMNSFSLRPPASKPGVLFCHEFLLRVPVRTAAACHHPSC